MAYKKNNYSKQDKTFNKKSSKNTKAKKDNKGKKGRFCLLEVKW